MLSLWLRPSYSRRTAKTPNQAVFLWLSSAVFLAALNFSSASFANTTYYSDTREAYKFSRSESQPKIAIIIDDIGYNIPLGQRTVDLPGAITLAVLPKTPGAQSLSREGFKKGKEIMLHAPMSNHNEFALGPGALTEELSKEEFLKTLNANIDNIPHIVGVNNHMGSRLTTQRKQMNWVMETLAKRDLYFVDSLTHGASVAYRTAKKYGITSTQRDIFLDHHIDEALITVQFERLIKRAKNQGYAIGIGHPYPETLNVLEKYIPQLKQHNIQLVHVSTLLNFDKSRKLAANKTQ